MTWPGIFLGCFIVGFALSVLSFASNAVGVHFHVHVPFMHDIHGAHLHLGQAPSSGVSFINFPTMMVFLAWFGGTGYLLTSEFRWLAVPALGVATLAGLAGSAIIFWLMARVLWSPHENMQSVDYQMVGVLGQVSRAIREGGTGELVYSRGGARHSCAVRSADGTPIDKGAEVVVTVYERGIAYVRRWDDLAAGN